MMSFEEKTISEIVKSINTCVNELHRDGAVIPTSGGIDSATVLKLSSMALGVDNIRALFLPDGSSSPESIQYAMDASKAAGCTLITQNISEVVEALTNNQALSIVKKYYPDFSESIHGYSLELNLEISIRLGTPYYELAIGDIHNDSSYRKVIAADDLRILIANQNVKQRLRMIASYRLAEALHYAVGGTSNKDEREFGFAVKYGDAASDYYPIINLNKKEVISLAKAIGVPNSIINRTPTTDTYSLKQTQQKFFFGLPAELMRLASNKLSSDEEIKQACINEGIQCSSVDGVRSLVKFLSGSALYNEAQYFCDPKNGWKFAKMGECSL